jgi:enamine deaminase RidA (YjgF/YER057c/UK114 family)
MKYNKQTIDTIDFEVSVFSKNDVDEIHLFAKPTIPGTFPEQIRQITQAHNHYLAANQIPEEAIIFSRYFVSDYANQSDALDLIRSHSKDSPHRPALSIVQQPPLSDNKIVVWSYLIHDKRQNASQFSKALTNNNLLVQRGSYRHLWSTRLSSNSDHLDSLGQTKQILSNYEGELKQNDLSFKDDCIRTWFYVKDIDYNYQGVVEARNQFFDELGLTPETHYVSSTGIEGREANPKTSVMMDAYSVGGLSQEQIRFLEAPTHLNPTHEYGVTFERGTSVDYGDRRHVLISGTASIDNKGEILHRNDVGKQTARAVENIIALLNDTHLSMQDVTHMIVYLRDLSDISTVKHFFDENHQDIPKVFVLAPVCRPGWLVEIECMAIASVENPTYLAF